MILLHLFLTFFKIGLFTIGGGYAMIPMITSEVTGNGWASLTTIIDFIAISESTPGPFAINIATFIGQHTAGFWGAALATLGVVLPSFIIILIVARFFTSFGGNRYVKAALAGLRPAVLGLILAAAWSVARVNLILPEETGWRMLSWRALAVAGLCFLLLRRTKIHPGVIMLIAAGMGIILFGFLGEWALP